MKPALGISGASMATFLGQAVGWCRSDQGAGLCSAFVETILVLFAWDRFSAWRTP
jgi:uncharacterized membrane protein YeaQ/YmgE (transglycosylase-associated protein family)